MDQPTPTTRQSMLQYPPGSSPGQLRPPPGARSPVIDVFAYNETDLVEKRGVSVEEAIALKSRYPVLWINVEGLADPDVVARLGDAFGLHWLALEDVMHTTQRPKVEDYAGHAFIVARMLLANTTETEQVAMFLGADYLITFQEKPGDCLDPIRGRIRRGGGRIRRSGADYLCYAIIDAIIDGYFPALERHGETLERLEGEMTIAPDRWHVSRLHKLKRELLTLRRAIWPHREMLAQLLRQEGETISEGTRIFFRDCYDHTVQLMDIVETDREMASELMDLYMSAVNAKLNEVMKVLTIISTIFMPLSFIASVYGMNFDRQASPWNMPELGWRLGYPFALLLMATTATTFLVYFWRRGWLGDSRRRRRYERRERAERDEARAAATGGGRS